jgi:glutamate--cysteine ligase
VRTVHDDSPGLSPDDAEAHVRGVCFKTGPPGRVGVELEWLVKDSADPAAAVSPRRLAEALAPLVLPAGSPLSLEPGGQVELSSPPASSLLACLRATATDAAALRQALGAAGLVLAGEGLDPYRDPPRVLTQPRYDAMEAFFDRAGPCGRMMMRATAGVQVNLDAGDESGGLSDYRRRWRLVHRLGPPLVAAFANSPLWRGRPTGWCSTRQAVWARLDPYRARPPVPHADPRGAWARHALDSELMCVRRPEPYDWRAPSGLTFRAWAAGDGDGLRRPTREDLDYHLSTLFPPIRPRGWLELRMIDALPGDDWMVAAAVATVLLDDPVAADAAWNATDPLCAGPGEQPDEAVWTRAARVGPADPALGKAVRACFTAAEAALASLPGAEPLRRAVTAYAERYPERGRCPADDRLDALRRESGAPIPEGPSTWWT